MKLFKMTEKEMEEILEINRTTFSPVVLLFGKFDMSQNLAEVINSYWEKLGEKYGFDSLTVKPSDESKLHFTAEPTK